MFYGIIFLHILIMIEAYLLYQQKLRKKAILLGGSNLIFFVMNGLGFLKTLSIPYSSIQYFQGELANHGISNVLWILFNFLFFFFGIFILNFASKRKKQNIWFKRVIFAFTFFFLLFFLMILMKKIASLLVFLFALSLIFYLGKEYVDQKKNYYFVLLFLLGVITFYSYCTYTGSARLSILLMGYPKEAYETGLEELKYYEEKDFKRFSPIAEIKLKNGRIHLIDVKNYGFIKFSTISDDVKNN